MALFTDGPASSIADLAAQDSQLLNLANAEGIDLTVKLGLAHEAVGLELENLLSLGSSYRLEQVVATRAVRLWHTYRTLELVYRDAYHSQLNDRYAAKRDQFRELGKWAYDRLRQGGVGITLSPLPQAPPPMLEPAAGGLAEGMYYAAVAWVNETGEEGACSQASAIEITGGGFSVTPAVAPNGVSGWHLYAGQAHENLTRQNGAPVAPGLTWWAASVSESGTRPGPGQSPTLTHAIPRILQRG